MKRITHLLTLLSLLLIQTSFAQTANVPKPGVKKPTIVLAKSVPTKSTVLPIRALVSMTNGRTIAIDSSRIKAHEVRAEPSLLTKTATVSTSTDIVKPIPEAPNRVEVANPQLVSVLQTKPYLMPLDKASVRGSYPLGISATKTTHIIFPAKIREFDAGTDYVLAQVPESVSNVLRVKANEKSEFCTPGSTVETNMTIITDDGNLYSFLVRHQADPEVLNITIANNRLADEQSARTQGINQASAIVVMLTSGPTKGRTPYRTEVSDTELRQDCERIFERKGFIRRVGDSKLRISSHLKGLYVNGKVMYLQLTFQNDSDIDYDVDFVKFYLRDRDVLKRMAAQEVELTPYLTYPNDLRTIKANTDNKAIYALPLRTLGDDKVLEVELYERDGGRHLRFRVDSSELLKTRSI